MKRRFIFLLTIILFIIAVFGLIFVYQISAKAYFEGQKEFVIKKGESVQEISNNLFYNDLINSRLAFKIYLYLRGWQGSVQAGTYILTSMNIIDLTQTLVAGKVDNEIRLQFIEGWTLNDIAEYLIEKNISDSEKLLDDKDEFLDIAQVKNFQLEYSFLDNISGQSLEGFLFPDTYLVYKDAGLKEIITKMLDNFDQKLTPALITEIRAQGKNLYDTLIIASIIEKEVSKDEDRRIVSGILWKRLDIDMPLQVDASLKYVIGGKNPNLTAEELKIDSAYNTYKYKGLPPSPICNPGQSAIRAAIYPKDSDYWYYLSTKNEETIFSKTREEHERNVEKYLRNPVEF